MSCRSLLVLLLVPLAACFARSDCGEGTVEAKDGECVAAEDSGGTPDSAGDDTSADADTDTDSDTDADSDTDTDADSDADSDTDTDTDTTASPARIILYDDDCGGGTCSWSVEADGEIGTVQLWIIETGDPTFDPGCDDDVGSGGLVCGVWSEYHNDFALATSDNEFGGDTKRISLELVDSYMDQVSNFSTLFDMSNPTIADQVTFEFDISDRDGNYADCVAFGDEPSYFDCPNVF
jgi:hypothetical protein